MTETPQARSSKRKRSLSSGPSLPLTRANLRLLHSMTNDASMRLSPLQTTTRSRSTTPSSQPLAKIRAEFRLLAEHKIYEDELELEDRPQLKSFVEDIIDSDRWSEPSQRSVNRLGKIYKRRKYSDKGAFLSGVLPLIIKSNRAFKKNNASGEEEEIVLEDWEDTILAIASCYQPFATHSFPLNDREEGRFRTPKPDYTYGTTLDEVPLKPVIREKIESRMRICETMENPFFIIEATSIQGLQQLTMAEAMWAGTALVYAMEEIWRSIHDEQYETPATEQPQIRSAVFSFIIHPLRATFYINWCQHMRGENSGPFYTKYYMTEVKAWLLGEDDLDTLVSCRRALNNILAWGIGHRHTRFWDMVKAANRKAELVSRLSSPVADDAVNS